jgi:sialic acid synthase SpsE
MGTCYIEKHFTLDVTLPGSDHAMSMNPIQMKRLCDLIKKINPDSCAITQMPEMLSVLGIKTSKQEVELILGNKTRELSAVEKSQIIWARKSIVAEKTIEAGQVLKEEDIVIKRPQKGILPKDRDMVLGKKAKLSIEAGTPINWDMLS